MFNENDIFSLWQNGASDGGKELPILNALVSGQQNVRLQQPFQGNWK